MIVNFHVKKLNVWGKLSLLQSNPKTCLVFRQAPKCIVWIPFGLIDIFVLVGFSKASQGQLFEPYLWECDFKSLGRQKGLTQNRCHGLVCLCFLINPSLKRVLTRGLLNSISCESKRGLMSFVCSNLFLPGPLSPFRGDGVKVAISHLDDVFYDRHGWVEVLLCLWRHLHHQGSSCLQAS